MQTITLKEARPLILDTIQAGLVPMLHSPPGVGKSDLTKSIAKEHNLLLIDLRLAQMDPTDMNGFPLLNKDTMRSDYAPPMTIPLEGDPIPAGYSGWLVFLDEINAASNAVQAAAYKVILDKQIGSHNIHKNVAMIAAGNLATDKAIVNRPSTALQSRMVHYSVAAENSAWLEWAIQNDIDYRVMGFLRFRPELLHKFDPNHDDFTFAAPRTWEFLSLQIKSMKEITVDKIPLLCGTVGEGNGIEFKSFTDIYAELPTKEQIIRDPANCPMPKEPSASYAITSLLSHIANDSNITSLMTYVNRLPVEFQIVTLAGILKEDRGLLTNPAVSTWIAANSREFL